MPLEYSASRWPTLISVINDTLCKQPGFDIRTLLNSFRRQFWKQQIAAESLVVPLNVNNK
jgi:hypothetical protein